MYDANGLKTQINYDSKYHIIERFIEVICLFWLYRRWDFWEKVNKNIKKNKNSWNYFAKSMKTLQNVFFLKVEVRIYFKNE